MHAVVAAPAAAVLVGPSAGRAARCQLLEAGRRGTSELARKLCQVVCQSVARACVAHFVRTRTRLLVPDLTSDGCRAPRWAAHARTGEVSLVFPRAPRRARIDRALNEWQNGPRSTHEDQLVQLES